MTSTLGILFFFYLTIKLEILKICYTLYLTSLNHIINAICNILLNLPITINILYNTNIITITTIIINIGTLLITITNTLTFNATTNTKILLSTNNNT